jgi:hypothetical protein
MAVAYLNNGATSFADANWSDGAGFTTANAELVIPGGSNSITADVDQGSDNIRFLRIARDFSGNIGTSTAPLDVDAYDGAHAEWSTANNNEGRIVHSGTGSLFVQSDADGITNIIQDGPGKTFLVSGAAPFVRVNAGTFQAETASTIATKLTLNGGSATLLTKTTGPTTINVHGGSHTLNRPGTTINVYSGRVIVECDNAGSTDVTINIFGADAYVEIVSLTTSGTVNVNRYAGMFETARLKKDLTIATMYTAAPAKFGSLPKGGGLLTITNQYKLDPGAQSI